MSSKCIRFKYINLEYFDLKKLQISSHILNSEIDENVNAYNEQVMQYISWHAAIFIFTIFATCVMIPNFSITMCLTVDRNRKRIKKIQI